MKTRKQLKVNYNSTIKSTIKITTISIIMLILLYLLTLIYPLDCITKGGAFGAWSGYGAGNDRSAFAYDPVSGETHTQNEWAAIASNYPEKAGSYDGEIANTYFKWHAGGERWMWMGPKF